MSVYVGIDVHRRRSQVAVVTGDGTVELNKNVVNGTETLLRLIGDLPQGTPVASEAAFGWGWLVRLLEEYGFHLRHDRETPREEDRHHRDLPQAPDPRLAPAGRHAGH
jgi:transposase